MLKLHKRKISDFSYTPFPTTYQNEDDELDNSMLDSNLDADLELSEQYKEDVSDKLHTSNENTADVTQPYKTIKPLIPRPQKMANINHFTSVAPQTRRTIMRITPMRYTPKLLTRRPKISLTPLITSPFDINEDSPITSYQVESLITHSNNTLTTPFPIGNFDLEELDLSLNETETMKNHGLLTPAKSENENSPFSSNDFEGEKFTNSPNNAHLTHATPQPRRTVMKITPMRYTPRLLTRRPKTTDVTHEFIPLTTQPDALPPENSPKLSYQTQSPTKLPNFTIATSFPIGYFDELNLLFTKSTLRFPYRTEDPLLNQRLFLGTKMHFESNKTEMEQTRGLLTPAITENDNHVTNNAPQTRRTVMKVTPMRYTPKLLTRRPKIMNVTQEFTPTTTQPGSLETTQASPSLTELMTSFSTNNGTTVIVDIDIENKDYENDKGKAIEIDEEESEISTPVIQPLQTPITLDLPYAGSSDITEMEDFTTYEEYSSTSHQAESAITLANFTLTTHSPIGDFDELNLLLTKYTARYPIATEDMFLKQLLYLRTKEHFKSNKTEVEETHGSLTPVMNENEIPAFTPTDFKQEEIVGLASESFEQGKLSSPVLDTTGNLIDKLKLAHKQLMLLTSQPTVIKDFHDPLLTFEESFIGDNTNLTETTNGELNTSELEVLVAAFGSLESDNPIIEEGITRNGITEKLEPTIPMVKPPDLKFSQATVSDVKLPIASNFVTPSSATVEQEQQSTTLKKNIEEVADDELKHFPGHETSTLCAGCNKTASITYGNNLQYTQTVSEQQKDTTFAETLDTTMKIEAATEIDKDEFPFSPMLANPISPKFTDVTETYDVTLTPIDILNEGTHTTNDYMESTNDEGPSLTTGEGKGVNVIDYTMEAHGEKNQQTVPSPERHYSNIGEELTTAVVPLYHGQTQVNVQTNDVESEEGLTIPLPTGHFDELNLLFTKYTPMHPFATEDALLNRRLSLRTKLLNETEMEKNEVTNAINHTMEAHGEPNVVPTPEGGYSNIDEELTTYVHYNSELVEEHELQASTIEGMAGSSNIDDELTIVNHGKHSTKEQQLQISTVDDMEGYSKTDEDVLNSNFHKELTSNIDNANELNHSGFGHENTTFVVSDSTKEELQTDNAENKSNLHVEEENTTTVVTANDTQNHSVIAGHDDLTTINIEEETPSQNQLLTASNNIQLHTTTSFADFLSTGLAKTEELATIFDWSTNTGSTNEEGEHNIENTTTTTTEGTNHSFLDNNSTQFITLNYHNLTVSNTIMRTISENISVTELINESSTASDKVYTSLVSSAEANLTSFTASSLQNPPSKSLENSQNVITDATTIKDFGEEATYSQTISMEDLVVDKNNSLTETVEALNLPTTERSNSTISALDSSTSPLPNSSIKIENEHPINTSKITKNTEVEKPSTPFMKPTRDISDEELQHFVRPETSTICETCNKSNSEFTTSHNAELTAAIQKGESEILKHTEVATFSTLFIKPTREALDEELNKFSHSETSTLCETCKESNSQFTTSHNAELTSATQKGESEILKHTEVAKSSTLFIKPTREVLDEELNKFSHYETSTLCETCKKSNNSQSQSTQLLENLSEDATASETLKLTTSFSTSQITTPSTRVVENTIESLANKEFGNQQTTISSLHNAEVTLAKVTSEIHIEEMGSTKFVEHSSERTNAMVPIGAGSSELMILSTKAVLNNVEGVLGKESSNGHFSSSNSQYTPLTSLMQKGETAFIETLPEHTNTVEIIHPSSEIITSTEVIENTIESIESSLHATDGDSINQTALDATTHVAYTFSIPLIHFTIKMEEERPINTSEISKHTEVAETSTSFIVPTRNVLDEELQQFSHHETSTIYEVRTGSKKLFTASYNAELTSIIPQEESKNTVFLEHSSEHLNTDAQTSEIITSFTALAENTFEEVASRESSDQQLTTSHLHHAEVTSVIKQEETESTGLLEHHTEQTNTVETIHAETSDTVVPFPTIAENTIETILDKVPINQHLSTLQLPFAEGTSVIQLEKTESTVFVETSETAVVENTIESVPDKVSIDQHLTTSHLPFVGGTSVIQQKETESTSSLEHSSERTNTMETIHVETHVPFTAVEKNTIESVAEKVSIDQHSTTSHLPFVGGTSVIQKEETESTSFLEHSSERTNTMETIHVETPETHVPFTAIEKSTIESVAEKVSIDQHLTTSHLPFVGGTSVIQKEETESTSFLEHSSERTNTMETIHVETPETHVPFTAIEKSTIESVAEKVSIDQHLTTSHLPFVGGTSVIQKEETESTSFLEHSSERTHSIIHDGLVETTASLNYATAEEVSIIATTASVAKNESFTYDTFPTELIANTTFSIPVHIHLTTHVDEPFENTLKLEHELDITNTPINQPSTSFPPTDFINSIPGIPDIHRKNNKSSTEIYINLPFYPINSTDAVDNFEKYYSISTTNSSLIIDDEATDLVVSENEFRTMKLQDFQLITEFPPTISSGPNNTNYISKIPTKEDSTKASSTSSPSSSKPNFFVHILGITKSTRSTTTNSIHSPSLEITSHIYENSLGDANTEEVLHQTANLNETTSISGETSPIVNTTTINYSMNLYTTEIEKSLQESTCNITDFQAHNHCICSMDNLVQDLRSKYSQNIIVNMNNYTCPVLSHIDSGITLGNNSIPRMGKIRRNVDRMGISITKREIIDNKNIEKTLNEQLDLINTDNEIIATPGMKIRIPCVQSNKNIPQNIVNYSWTFSYDLPITEGRVQETEGALIIENVSPQDGGNYTCTILSAIGDTTSSKMFEHHLSIVTLPTYTITNSILYNSTASCENGDTDILSLFLPDTLAGLICGNFLKVCSVDVKNAQCWNKSNEYMFANLSTFVEPLNAIMPILNTTICDVNCEMKIYTRLTVFIIKNLETISKLPVFFMLPYRQQHLIPIETLLKTDNKQGIATEAPKLVIACPPGFGYHKKTHVCGACGRNEFSRGDETYCTKCPAGQFQPVVGSKSCLVCSSPLQDPFCLRVVYSNAKTFRIAIGVIVFILIFLTILLIFLKSSKKDERSTKSRNSKDDYRTKRRHSKRRQQDVDVEKQDMEPLLQKYKHKKSKHNRKPPEPPPPDFL